MSFESNCESAFVKDLIKYIKKYYSNYKELQEDFKEFGRFVFNELESLDGEIF